MKLEMEIKKAIFKHILLSKTLQDYIVFDHRSAENLAHIRAAETCDFETLLGSYEARRYRGRIFFVNVKRMHAQIHEDIRQFIACIAGQELYLAKSIMRGGDYHRNVEFFVASLVQWIEDIRKEERAKRRYR